jgi:hypothetical protein
MVTIIVVTWPILLPASCDAGKKTKKMLETVYMEHMEYFDESTTARMNILIDNFATISPIRPLDSFKIGQQALKHVEF